MRPLRWGIVGTARIAAKNWKSIQASGTSVVHAVASREAARSRQFIDACQKEAPFEALPVAVASYDELFAMPEVEAVYVPLPTGVRKEWVLRAAAAGKHVLCEKPCASSTADLREMIDACRAHGVQFMDGVMFMHNPRLARIREALDDDRSVGAIQRITSAFSFQMDASAFEANIRTNSALEPAGCAGDLGWYCIRFILWAMRWPLPREVTGRLLKEGGRGPQVVPLDFTADLAFSAGASASFSSSFVAPYQNRAHVNGSKGWLQVNDFVHPLDSHDIGFTVNQTDVRFPYCDCGPTHNRALGATQAIYMFRHFSQQVRSAQLNEEWPMWALRTQQVLDACLASARDGGRPVSL